MVQAMATICGGEPNPLDSTGLCLLSLDGGGVRGLSTLYILKNIMDRLNHERNKTANLPPWKPCEVFDIIGGTSTGGLIAIMLGRLEMNVDECIVAYINLAENVFCQKKSRLPFSLKGKVKAQFDSSKLEKAIQDTIKKASISETALLNDGIERGCRTFVCTVDQKTKSIVRLRSYSLPEEPSIPATICQAALATSAATTFFEPVHIGYRTFADGGLGANNPVDEVEGEAMNIWCSDSADLKPLVKCFLSIGTGNPGIKAFEESMFKFLGQTVVSIATETEETEKKFISKWRKHFDENRYFRFNVDQGLQTIGLDEYKKQGEMEAATERYLINQAQKNRVRDCIHNLRLKQNYTKTSFATVVNEYTVRTIRQQPADHTTARRPAPTTSEIHVYQYPELHIPYFVVRKEKFEAINKEFENGRKGTLRPPVIVLLGMGGAGKTQLALEYCRKAEAEKKFDSIFWIDASSPSTVIRSFGLAAEKIYGAEQEFSDPDVTITSVKQTLGQCKTTWLIVFDNFDRPDSFSKPVSNYWPNAATGAILFTSRHEGSKLLGPSIEVSEMSDDEGIKLLANRIGRSPNDEDKAHLQKIVSILGNLALAIDQAGSYILQHHLGLSLADYPLIYHSRKKNLLKEVPDSAFWHYSKKRSDDATSESALSVFTTWEMSYESIKGNSEQQLMKGLVLTMAAFLGNQGISEDMFQRYAEFVQPLPDYMAQFAPRRRWDKFNFRETISEFKNLSLIQSLSHTANGIHFALHPLVRDWAQLRASPDLQIRLCVDATTLVSLSLPDPDGPKSLHVPAEEERRLLQHMEECVKNCENYLDQDNLLGVGWLNEPGYRFAAFYSHIGGSLHQAAERILRRALDWRCERKITPDAKTVMLLLRLAWGCDGQKRYKECRSLSVEALELSEKFLNEDEPATWLAQRRIGLVHAHEQHMGKAAIWLQKCYSNQLKSFGIEHQATLSTILDLASVFVSELKLDKAEEYAKIALQGRISSCGLNAVPTFTAQLRLSHIFIKRGDIGNAEKLLLEILERGEVNFGSSSYRVASIKELLSETYRYQRRYSEALQLSTENMVIRENVYGKGSSQVVSDLVDLARINIEWANHGADNRGVGGDSTYEKARSLLLEAQTALQKLGGPDQWEELHWVRVWLVQVYERQHEYEKAEALTRELLANWKSKGSPVPLTDLLWMAYFLYAKQGKKIEMADLLERALSATRKRLGPKNINLLECLKRAETGYSILDSAEGMDKCSSEVLCLWDEVGGTKYHELKVDEAIAADAMKTPLPSALRSVCDGLWSWRWNGDQRVDERFIALLFAIIHSGDEFNGQIACERVLSRQALLNGFPQPLPGFSCDICHTVRFTGRIYFCKSCLSCVLCYECFSNYDNREHPVIISDALAKACSCFRHDFFRVPSEGWESLPLEVVDQGGQTVNDWIRRMRDMYGDVRYPANVDYVIGWAEITVIPEKIYSNLI